MNADILRSLVPRSIRSSTRTLRDYFHYRPMPWFQEKEVVKGPFSSATVAERLRADGICILESFLDEKAVCSCRDVLNSLILDFPNQGDTPGAYSHCIDFAQHPNLCRFDP